MLRGHEIHSKYIIHELCSLLFGNGKTGYLAVKVSKKERNQTLKDMLDKISPTECPLCGGNNAKKRLTWVELNFKAIFLAPE